MEGEEDDTNNVHYQNWDNDDYMVDNMSRVGSESSSYSASESSKYPTTENPSPASACEYHDSPREIKYSPDEMLLRPPSSSVLHYNYPHSRNFPGRSPNPYPQSYTHGGLAQYGGAYSFQPNMWYPNTQHGGCYFGTYSSHRYPHCNTGYSHNQIDMLQLSNSGREARNRAEKNRRDKLNSSIQELSTMVPHVAESPRRVDKTAVLRFAAHGLRLQYVFGDNINQHQAQLSDSLMKLLDSFFITLTCHGQIVLISSSIEQHLGHCQADLYGQNILHITHPEDHNMLKQQLIPTNLENLFDNHDDADEPTSRTMAEEEEIDRKLREDKRNFTVRLARAGAGRSEPTAFEVVKLDGSFRRSDLAPRGTKSNAFPSSLQLLRRTRGRDNAIPLHTISGNDIVLIAIARIIRPPKVMNRIIEASTLEYKTRHLIDGRIIDCDQRIGIVAGYMTDEVRNLSPFTFMHQDDVRWVIVALRQMYDCNSSYGESAYRLLTRNGNFIYLQSKGYLEIDKDSNKVHSFVCVNTLLDEEEGQRRVLEMKNKFSIIINTKIPQSSIDAPASDNPQQLEKAVLCLIQNLQKSDNEDILPSSFASGSVFTQDSLLSSSEARVRSLLSTKTPPLALVPPEASSVKTSISKSVNIVNVTAAKLLRGNQRVKSPRCDVPQNTEICTCQEIGTDCECCLAARKSSSMKRSTSCSKEEEIKAPKRRLKSTEIQDVLSSSLDQMGRSLKEQLNAAIELRDQSNKFDVPNSNQRIDEIMEEHQKQSEIFVNIKSEYEVQLHKKNIDANAMKSSETSELSGDLEPI